MNKNILFSVLLLASGFSSADEITADRPGSGDGYRECVAVSLHTMQGRELNSIVKNSRDIEITNLIPEGWSVIGVSEETEAGVTKPYLVICH